MIVLKSNIITIRHRFAQRLKFRNKYGYGVHSPFMFNFVMKVLKGNNNDVYTFLVNKKLPRNKRKYFTMLLKLINYYKPEKVFIRGNSYNEIFEYISLAWPKRFLNIENTDNCEFISTLQVNIISKIRSKIIILRKNSYALEEVCDFINTREFKNNKLRVCIVIEDINKNSYNHNLWLKFKNLATVTVDMSRCGIMLFDNNIQKGYYSVHL